MKEDEMEGACDTDERKKNAINFCLDNLKESDHVENPDE
jgi:hypothetical protein